MATGNNTSLQGCNTISENPVAFPALHCPEHAKLFANVKLYCRRIAGSQVCANSLRIALLQCCLPTAGPALKTFAQRRGSLHLHSTKN